MGFERSSSPEEEDRDADAFLKTLGPVMIVTGYTSIVSLTRSIEDGEYSPAIILRFEGHKNDSVEMVTSTVMLSPEDAEHLVQMIAEQAVMARKAPVPPPGWTP